MGELLQHFHLCRNQNERRHSLLNLQDMVWEAFRSAVFILLIPMPSLYTSTYFPHPYRFVLNHTKVWLCISGAHLKNMEAPFLGRVVGAGARTATDLTHPLNQEYQLLPSSRRYRVHLYRSQKSSFPTSQWRLLRGGRCITMAGKESMEWFQPHVWYHSIDSIPAIIMSRPPLSSHQYKSIE